MRVSRRPQPEALRQAAEAGLLEAGISDLEKVRYFLSRGSIRRTSARGRTVSRSAHIAPPHRLLDPATGGLDVPGYGLIPPFLHHRTERGLFSWAPFPDGRMLIAVSDYEPAADDPVRFGAGRLM